MSTRRWKIALAGLGAAARTIHLPAYRRLADAEVIAGFDPEVRPGEFPFPTFDSLEAMLEGARPDILVVASPPDTHFEATRQALEAGCHVLCEKPFMATLDEARRIVALAARVGRRVAVNQQYRFMDIHRESRRRVGSPEFGELLFVSARQTFRMDEATEAGWRGRDNQRTCKEFGIHVLDLCRFLFDADPLKMTARMPRPQAADDPDLLDLIQLTFPGDRSAEISLDRLTRGRHSYLELRLDGSRGCIETRLGGGLEVAFGIRGGSRRPFIDLDLSLGGRARLYRGERYRRIAAEPLAVFSRATSRLMAAYLAALERDEAPPCDGADNLRSLALMLAAYESDRLGAPMEFDPQSDELWRPRRAGEA